MDATIIGTQLRNAVLQAYQELSTKIDDAASQKPMQPGKWSPRQIMGHLIDSASNNHQRFARANFQEALIFPGYHQEEWVDLHDYQNMEWSAILELWKSFNFLIARLIDQTPLAVKQKVRDEHNLDQIAWMQVPANENTSLAYFMTDYIGHLEHHVKQILPNQK